MAPVLFWLPVWVWVGVRAQLDMEDARTQERLFLTVLGLPVRPRPAGTRQARPHVPSELWKMFRRSEGLQARESEPCAVSEYGVRGNIVRYVQDQGGSRAEVYEGY